MTPRNIDANHNATQDNVEQVTDFHGSQSGTQKSLGGTAGFLVSTNGRQHAVVKLASSQAGHPTFKICRNKFDKPCSKCDATQWKYWRNKWHTAKQQAGRHQTQANKAKQTWKSQWTPKHGRANTKLEQSENNQFRNSLAWLAHKLKALLVNIGFSILVWVHNNALCNYAGKVTGGCQQTQIEDKGE